MSISLRSNVFTIPAIGALCAFLVIAACASTGDAAVSPIERSSEGPTLAERNRDYFPIGAAVEAGSGKFNLA
jgi:hypothetical protein